MRSFKRTNFNQSWLRFLSFPQVMRFSIVNKNSEKLSLDIMHFESMQIYRLTSEKKIINYVVRLIDNFFLRWNNPKPQHLLENK